MRVVKFFAPLLSAALFAAGAAPAPVAARVLWPSSETEVRTLRDSRLSVLAEGAALVKTGTDYAWPGLRFDFAKGPCDLSSYALLTVSVSNALETALSVSLSVKSRALQGRSPGGKLVLPPHGTGDAPWCLGAFVDNELSWNDLPDLDAVAEQYFKVVSTVLRDELPHHLYLGCRIAWGTDGVYRAAAKYCDVVSVNVYDCAPLRDLPAGAADKPMINGEFPFGALDSGLFHPGLVATADQRARAQSYRDYVNACLDHPRFVGTHWFQYQDQPLTGRAEGERSAS